jgi:HTH-type transcriptional repressor of NAD biosynthesis genes
MANKQYPVGMYGGSFDPLHLGHVECIMRASNLCQKLYIAIDYNRQRDSVPIEIRASWLHQLTADMPHVKIVRIESRNLDKADYDWEAGTRDHIEAMGEVPDVVIMGGDYEGQGIFERLYPTSDIVYVPRDARSSTRIRRQPLKYWDDMPEYVRRHYLKRVVFVGTESCGKTTLVRNLAQHYNTSYVPEVGRDINQVIGDYYDMQPAHYSEIFYRHKVRELDEALRTRRVLLIDTEAIVTDYCHYLQFGKHHPLAAAVIDSQQYDLWILLEPDVQWVDDGLRCFGDDKLRVKNHQLLKKMLDDHGIKYATISGSYDERFVAAKRLIDQLIK